MRKGTVLSIKGLKIGSFISKNNILVILVALFIAGIAIGTFSYQKSCRVFRYIYSKIYFAEI